MKVRGYYKKILGTCLILSFMLQSVPVFAQFGPIIPLVNPNDILPPVPTGDGAYALKEVGIRVAGITLPGVTLDSIMIFFVRAIIEQLTDSVVSFINGKGTDAPAFAVDLEGLLLDTADAISGNIIAQVGAGKLCSPFRQDLVDALRISQNSRSARNADDLEISCSLSEVSNNIEGFLAGDFIGGGGWDAWYTMTQGAQNNPYGAYLSIESEIGNRIAEATGIEKEKLAWANGFIGTQDCEVEGEDGTCAEWGPTKTPGILIEGQLQKVLGSEVDQLNLADEFDEVLSALMGQLMASVFNPSKGILDNDGLKNRNVTKGAERERFGACFPNTTSAIVGDEITWSYSGSLGEFDTLSWSGDEGLSGTGTEAKITYTTKENKGASVTVTRVTKFPDDPSQADIVKQDPPIHCNDTVKVSLYGPLTVSCKVDKYNVPVHGILGDEPKPIKSTVLWTFTITGGSGQLASIVTHDWTPPDNESQFIDDGLDMVINPGYSPATQSFPANADGQVIVSRRVVYGIPGKKSMQIDIADKDDFVEPIQNFSCNQPVSAYVPGSN